MTQRKRDTKAILRTVARSERRSPLFRWMVEHHDDLIDASRRDGIHWASFCEEAAKRGLSDTRGLAPAPANARKTWAQARKAVEQGRAVAAAKQPRPTPPSRFPKGWTPPIVSESEIPVPPYLRPPGTALVLSPPPPLPSVPERQCGDDLPEPGSMEDLILSMDKADWHLLGGKRKRRTET